MTHKSSSRGSGAGGKIQTLELVAPVAITAGAEYFLTPDGSLVTQADVAPFIATPLVGTSLNTGIVNYCWGNQGVSSVSFIQHGDFTQFPNILSNARAQVVQLSAKFEAYVTTPVLTGTGYVSCFVYDKLTGELVAEGAFTLGLGDSNNYPRDGSLVAIVPSGANKFCLVCDWTGNGGSTWAFRVGEITFNGTNSVSFAWKTVLGTAAAGTGQLAGIGSGVSAGKIAVVRGTTYSIINVIANTINSAAGFTTQHQVEGQWGLSYPTTTTCSVTNYETNGSSSFTVTGAVLITNDRGIKLTSNVYLMGVSNLNSANQLRLVVFNAGFTAAVCTVMNHVGNAELQSPVVVQPKSGVLEFHIVSGLGSAKDSTAALVFTIDAAGAVVKAPKWYQQDATTRAFCTNLQYAGVEPVKLDKPVWHILQRPQDMSTPATQDAAAGIIVKYRPDFYISQYKPKYLGRALASAAQGAVATFAASPALLAVDPAQTAFQRVGRVIKVNDLQGFFFDYNNAQYGINQRLDNSQTSHTNIIDVGGMNYPWVVGQAGPVAKGKVQLAGPSYDADYNQTDIVAITAVGVNYFTATTQTSTSFPVTELSFYGFLVLAMRVNYFGNVTQGFGIVFDVEVEDYV